MANSPHIASSFDDFLRDEDIYEEATATAIKRVIAWLLEQEMQRQKITKSAMAERMHTSRSQLDRLLNPEVTSVSLEMMQRAAYALGRELRIELV